MTSASAYRPCRPGSSRSSRAFVVAFIQYGWRELRSGWATLPAALLRVGAVALVVALLLDAPASRAKPVSVWAALDASSSMARGDTHALARGARFGSRVAAESVFVFGDSARRDEFSDRSRTICRRSLRPAVERALGAGHPLVVVTDGELDDPDAARSSAGGLARRRAARTPRERESAVASIDVPRAVVSGDTVDVARWRRRRQCRGARRDARVDARRQDRSRPRRSTRLPPFGERSGRRARALEGPPGGSLLRAIVTAPDDAERRNDTLRVAVDLSRAASAVFVSTSPDFDARYALAVLRGALGIPTRGFFRVAPGEWRVEGALTPIPEADVRQARA